MKDAMKFFFFILSLHIAGSLFGANDPHLELKRISTIYSKSNLLIETEVNVYRNYSSDTSIETSYNLFAKENDKTYAKVGNIEKIINDGTLLIVDHLKKTISSYPSNNKKINDNFILNLDSLEKSSVDIKYATIDSEKALLVFLPFNSPFKYVKVEYFTKTGFISKIVLYYKDYVDSGIGEREKPRIEIAFLKTISDKDIGDDYFIINRFIEEKNNNVIATSKYKNYQVNKHTL